MEQEGRMEQEGQMTEKNGVERSTATEGLRRLLDERGVEWNKGKLAMLGDEYTQWWVYERMEGFVAYECDYPLNTLIVRGITPEQAIAATLGSCNCSDNCTNSERTNETCHADETDTWECVCDQIGRYGKRVTIHVMECSECGRTYEHVNGDYEFCPRCGRRIVGAGA